jgi:hypothetical protein
VNQHIALFRPSCNKSPAELATAALASILSIERMITELRNQQLALYAMKLEIQRLSLGVARLNQVRIALEAKTWMAFQARKAGGVRRAVGLKERHNVAKPYYSCQPGVFRHALHDTSTPLT